MQRWYVFLNIALLSLLIWFLVAHVFPNEYSDATQLNKQFARVKHNTECINYLQNVAVTPTWRFALISSFFFTLLLLMFYILAGGVFTEPKHYFAFWFLLILNWLFMYKSLATRMWHYTCDHGCSATFKEN